jgi:hypothetical protein
MSKHFMATLALALTTAAAAIAQDQAKPIPGVTAPPAQQRSTTYSGNVKCPASITATVNPGNGWNGGSYTATLFNLSAMDGSRTDCIYNFEYVTITKPAPAGQKCTVAADKKSFNCK